MITYILDKKRMSLSRQDRYFVHIDGEDSHIVTWSSMTHKGLLWTARDFKGRVEVAKTRDQAVELLLRSTSVKHGIM